MTKVAFFNYSKVMTLVSYDEIQQISHSNFIVICFTALSKSDSSSELKMQWMIPDN